MDLGAYINIEKFEEIAKKNHIEIPKLRGYRLMAEEKKVPEEEIKDMLTSCEISIVEDLCEAYPFWSINPEWHECSTWTDMLKDYYLIKNPNKEDIGYQKYIGVRWNRIHGWKRKILKFEIKKQKRKIREQYDLWNQYVGKKNILYIHSKLGGSNWNSFKDKNTLMNQPWFLNRVDDCYDSKYCDFYAKIEL